jgi:hypothetical protein
LLKLGPAIAFLGATPIAALAPVIIVWVGTGITSKVAPSDAWNAGASGGASWRFPRDPKR